MQLVKTYAVREDDAADVLLRPGVEDLRDVADVVDRDVEASWRLAVDVAELHTRLAHGRCVHDRHELGRVLDEEAVVDRLVRVLHALHEDVLLDRRRLLAQLRERARGLELDARHAHRHEALEPELRTLGLREREALHSGSQRAHTLASSFLFRSVNQSSRHQHCSARSASRGAEPHLVGARVAQRPVSRLSGR